MSRGISLMMSICHRVYLMMMMMRMSVKLMMMLIASSIYGSLVVEPWVKIGLENWFSWDAPWVNYFL